MIPFPFTKYRVSIDPLYADVVANVHGNGTNGGTTITDSKGLHTWTANGSAQTSTAQSLFGGSSILLNGSTDYLTAGPTSDFNSNTGDFCIEWSCYFNASGRQYMTDMGGPGDPNHAAIIITPSSGLIEIYNGVFVINTGSTPFNTGQWYRFCWERVGSVVTIYRDGVAYASNGAYGGAWGSSTGTLFFGCAANTTQFSSAYYAEIRMTQGQHRYNGNYTPAGPFPNA